VHELGIAENVLTSVRAEMDRRPGARPVKLGLVIGELSAVDPEALRFCLTALVRDTEFDPLEVDIEWVPRTHRCGRCGREFPVVDLQTACPGCGAADTKFVRGYELDIAYLELEEPCPG
jgi:hydrogenase nickel incorporation protein HypA/HybF